MNKKFIIPIVICTIIIIAVISTCVGKGSKIKLTWDAVPAPKETKDSIELKVYVENSGSMDAYMCAGSKSGKTKCARFEKRNVQKSGKTKRSKKFAHTTL